MNWLVVWRLTGLLSFIFMVSPLWMADGESVCWRNDSLGWGFLADKDPVIFFLSASAFKSF